MRNLRGLLIIVTYVMFASSTTYAKAHFETKSVPMKKDNQYDVYGIPLTAPGAIEYSRLEELGNDPSEANDWSIDSAKGLLARSLNYHGIEFPSGTYSEVFKFRANFISRGPTPLICGQIFSAGTRVELSPLDQSNSGAYNLMVSLKLVANETVKGITFSKNTNLSFVCDQRTGELLFREGEILNEVMLWGIRIPASSSFDRLFCSDAYCNGITRIDLRAPTKVNGILVKNDLIFNKKGFPTDVVLAEATRLQEIDLPSGSAVEFYPSGRIRSIAAPKPLRINNYDVPAGHPVTLSEEGKIIKVGNVW